MKLDLHGKSHYEISNLVDQFIWEGMIRGKHEVEIVTGNSDRMKDFVIKSIQDYKLEYKIGDLWNQGYIRVFLK
jgi:DNA-nicking Smr family endonuclease